MLNKKPIIGLLGAPGSGKSSVADQLEKLGCAVVRADQINHALLKQVEIIERIVNEFGPSVLDSGGQIDRAVLGDIVFFDDLAREKLNGLLHPLVEKEEERLIERYQQESGAKAIVLDVPLLLEVGQDKWCDVLIYLFSDKEVRENRLKKDRGWTEKKMKNVENSQITLDIKAKISDHGVKNNSSISDLAIRCEEVLSQILEK
jgi:dephospho-CoA kinase